MATIRCWALHGNINDAISYVLDVKNEEEKTEGMYYEGSDCDPYVAAYHWKVKYYKKMKKNDIVGFHFQQSFEPGTVSKEEAFEISKKWINEILKGEYEYVIALHTDKASIHTHIIVNPYSKKTGKKLQLYYKKDIPEFKKISDRICKEHGLTTLDLSNEEHSMSYYEWMRKNQGDSLKDIVAKTLDNLVERVSSYDELKQYLQIIGYTVEDGISDNRNMFTFTGDIKLVKDRSKDEMIVRLPYTTNTMIVKQSDVNWIKENKTFKISYNLEKPVDIYDKDGHYLKTMKAKELDLNWERKNNHQRNGLRIKVPNSQKFIRCNRIEGNYSLDQIIEKIENNGRLVCDESIRQVIDKGMDLVDSKKEKDKFYSQIDVKARWLKENKKDRYIAWRTSQLQNKLNQMEVNKESLHNLEYLDVMKKNLVQLKKDFRELNDDIRKQEKKVNKLEIDRMEGEVEVTEAQIKEYVDENITPLYKIKKEMSEKMRELDAKIKQTEQFKEQEKSKETEEIVK